MHRRVVFLIIALFLAPLCVKAEGVALSVDEAVSIALRDNRDILLKVEDIRKAKAKLAEADAALFPTITASGGWEMTRNLYYKDISQNYGRLSLKQPIYRGGAVINTIKYSGYSLEAIKSVLDKAKLDIVYEVRNAFYTLMLAQEYARLNKEVLANTAAHLKYVNTRYGAGEASATDVLRIESSLANVQQAYEASLNQIESSQAILVNLLAMDKKVRINPATQFAFEPQEVAFDEALLKALAQRPDIRQYEMQIKASEKNVEISKASSRPEVYASWDYYSFSHQFDVTGISRNWNDYNTLGISVSWPIFDGWATKARVEQAIVDLKESRIMKDKLLGDIAVDVKTAYISMKDAVAKVKSSSQDIAYYKDHLDVARTQYKEGTASSLYLQDVTLSYEVSLFNQKQAIFDYTIAKYSLERATGGAS